MCELSIVRKYSLGQHSFKAIDFQDTITIEDSTDDKEVLAAFQQMLARVDRAWTMYREYIEETHGTKLPAY